MTKRIEIWYTGERGREYETANSPKEANQIASQLKAGGFCGIVIDTYYYDKRDDLIESKTKHKYVN